jgi:mevalonate kinase
MTAPPAQSEGFGHGKVVLLGEHAVVYGQPALAAGIAAGVRAVATPGEGRLRVPAWGLEARVGEASPVGEALARLLARLGAPALDFHAVADIPSRAGLGSSAALAVALARAVAARTGAGADEIAAAAHEAESVFHGTPSGMDAAAATHGGVGRFVRGEGWRPVAVRQPFKLLVGFSGKPRHTLAQVETVALLCRRTPVARRLVDTLGEVTAAGIEAVERGDIDTLGRLFDIAHGLLAGLRVSSPELEALVHGARAAGALGAKLTGAGGGGAVIALAPSHREDVLARWRADGFDGMVTEVGRG